MPKLIEEILYDLRFVRSHTLQPKWYKFFKVFLLIGLFLGYWWLFGILKTLAFFFIFIFLCLLLHLLYRVKTSKFTQSWLDFVVAVENNEIKAKSIGKFYYSMIVLNAAISFIFSQVFL